MVAAGLCVVVGGWQVGLVSETMMTAKPEASLPQGGGGGMLFPPQESPAPTSAAADVVAAEGAVPPTETKVSGDSFGARADKAPVAATGNERDRFMDLASDGGKQQQATMSESKPAPVISLSGKDEKASDVGERENAKRWSVPKAGIVAGKKQSLNLAEEVDEARAAPSSIPVTVFGVPGYSPINKGLLRFQSRFPNSLAAIGCLSKRMRQAAWEKVS
jgi:hypothetical protein